MRAPTAVQPSLFDQMWEPEPTRQQLLDSLEQLFQATEACCDLPEMVIDPGVSHITIKKGDPFPVVPSVAHGGKTFTDNPVTVAWPFEEEVTVAISYGSRVPSVTPRSEHLCPGYAARRVADEHTLARMIYQISLVVLTSSREVFHLHARPNCDLVRQCVDVAAAWLYCHPQPTQEQEERLHELNGLTQGGGFYPDEYRQGRIKFLQTWFDYDEEKRTYSFANRG